MPRTNLRNIVLSVMFCSAVWMAFDYYNTLLGIIAFGLSIFLAIKFLRSTPDGRSLRSRVPLLSQGMTPEQFEHAVAERMTQDGWECQVMGGSGDRGIDVRAVNQDGDLAVIQCKYYGPNTTVTPTQVRDLAGARSIAGAAIASMVTTGTLSDQARMEARDAGIEVIEGESTRRWMSGRSVL